MAESNVGNFVWYELMTTDPQGAIAFYGEVIGWKTEAYDPTSDYRMWVASQGPLGGVSKSQAPGIPPHWMCNVRVADVDASVAKVKEMGGAVHVQPTDMPNIGRFAVIADPQGASLALYQPAMSMPLHDDTQHGEFTWNELTTTDWEAAWKFYSALFGWKHFDDMDMGPMGKYRLFGLGEKQFGGMFNKTPQMAMPPAWVYYVNVDDLDAAIERAKRSGGKVLNGPVQVPTGNRVAQLMDPQGAVFALHGK